MSEDMVQANQVTIDRYKYLRLGATTLRQLKSQGFITGSVPTADLQRKPDGIVFLPSGGIKAVVEVKPPTVLSASALQNIVESYAPIAAAVCNLLIITDGQQSYWFNPHTLKPAMADGSEIRELFSPSDIEAGRLSSESELKLASLIEECDQHLSAENDSLAPVQVQDPTQLARTVWQKIWVRTGKDPEQCLYNVVELILFKFLSDIGVLKGSYAFSSVIDYSREDDLTALTYYANMVRPRIRALFPDSVHDQTTIINGTIFVNENGDPNSAQASLFGEVLKDFQAFDGEYGSLRHIDRNFKTRLFESFLRQSAGIKALGQYFTPRNVVQTMVRMARTDQLPKGSRICDPFCGVGGFVLETIAENQDILNSFVPRNGVIEPAYEIIGYDRGSDERDDERTIILAKANMLIYLSDLLSTYHSDSNLREYATKVFNNTFRLIRSNLGTFGIVDDDPYDLILTNPPYVTSGSSSMRKAIADAGLSAHYSNIGRGIESLAMEWIVRNLKPDGQAYVVVPDGLMNQSGVLEYLKEECFINCVVALPSRTFFSTPKKTYILGIKKKRGQHQRQAEPVFTYLVSEIGESRDARRWEIDQNDLVEMEQLYRYFMADQLRFSSQAPRCKIIPFESFNSRSQWLVDRDWTREEKEALGLVEEITTVDEDTFAEMVRGAIKDLEKFLGELSASAS